MVQLMPLPLHHVLVTCLTSVSRTAAVVDTSPGGV